jgi:dynein heavy chain
MEKFNRLLKAMRASLIDLEKAIFGFILMSETLDDMFLRLQNGQVPNNWAKVAYPSLKPLASWFADLIKRVEFMREWLVNGNPNSFWLPGMYFPQGFLTGVLQTHARQHRIAIDQLAFEFTVLHEEGPTEIEEKPEDGVYIYGLYMDGARYNRDIACIDE